MQTFLFVKHEWQCNITGCCSDAMYRSLKGRQPQQQQLPGKQRKHYEKNKNDTLHAKKAAAACRTMSRTSLRPWKTLLRLFRWAIGVIHPSTVPLDARVS
jgi:hypothetical protein